MINADYIIRKTLYDYFLEYDIETDTKRGRDKSERLRKKGNFGRKFR